MPKNKKIERFQKVYHELLSKNLITDASDLADKLGVPHNTINALLEAITTLSPQLIGKLEFTFNVNPNYFIYQKQEIFQLNKEVEKPKFDIDRDIPNISLIALRKFCIDQQKTVNTLKKELQDLIQENQELKQKYKELAQIYIDSMKIKPGINQI